MNAAESNAAPYLTGAEGMLAPYIGKPWARGADGPDAFDCWGLVTAAARDVFGLHFPNLPHSAHAPADVARMAAGYLASGEWLETPHAHAGAVLALCGYEGRVRHVALCVSAHRCLHIAGATRSCVLPIARLSSLYPVARFYTWAP